jgi:Spy/CpxP family protein refolding chaperone
MKRSYVLAMLLAILWLVGGLSLTPSVLARSPEHEHDRFGRFEAHIQRRLQPLGLSDSQQSTVQTLLRTHAKEVIRLKAEIDTMRLDFQQLLHTDPVDLSKVKPALQAIAAKKADLQLAHITVRHEIRQVLTPEQQKKFRARPERHHSRDDDERRPRGDGERR